MSIPPEPVTPIFTFPCRERAGGTLWKKEGEDTEPSRRRTLGHGYARQSAFPPPARGVMTSRKVATCADFGPRATAQKKDGRKEIPVWKIACDSLNGKKCGQHLA
ncbi:hypothetical protein B0H16DRAFT_1452478 [Mycena metata]|uniref:Uncharacterized protein n=1 Tax=Mycena metata TaxID=1033252 RepID=A0AAD7NNU1_9AGAR|nr:hypothetical protein B0H16DRAFT_1462264 [Mycena metata]KAJ7769269.1 hypothetical protein B0H16DRAFT_1452478 [Mycena metata]